MKILDQQLLALLQSYAEQGLMTHAYAAAGSLAPGSRPIIEAKLDPGGRDIFDLASLTKALATSPLIFHFLPELYDQQDLRVRDVLEDLTSEQRNLSWLKELRLMDLLRHSSGLPAWLNFWVCRAVHGGKRLPAQDRHDLILETLSRSLSNARPRSGESVYSDVGFLILGLLLERLGGKPLNELFDTWAKAVLKTELLTPRFGPVFEYQDRCVSSGWCEVRGRELIGEVHDENCAALGAVTGHCGLFGTGPDLVRHLSAMAIEPSSRRFLELNRAFVLDPQRQPGNEALAGWRQGADCSSLTFAGGKGLGHLGFTGVGFWVDLDRGIYSLLLTNRIRMGRLDRRIVELRAKTFAILDQAPLSHATA